MAIISRPAPDESAEYYLKYINRVSAGDIRRILEAQTDEVIGLFEPISEKDSRYRYAPDKWTIRQVLNHINDCERLFTFRAFWFARNFDSPLPSFEQEIAAAAAAADDRPLRSHLDEFKSVRAATVSFFLSLAPEAWDRKGIASGNPVTVRALAFIAAGHADHHSQILKERYLAGIAAL
jgi:hypothetical protein